MKRFHLFSISISACLYAFCAVSASLFLFSSCDLFTYKRSFSDEYYGEANFIESIGFDAIVPVTDPDADPEDPVTGQWDFAWRYATDWAVGIPYPYMTPAPTADANCKTAGASGWLDPDGLSADAPVYRLELANLVTGGDFEGCDPLAYWTWNIADSAFYTFEGCGSIHGYSLSIEMLKVGDKAVWTIVLPDNASSAYELYFNWTGDNPVTDVSSAIKVNNSSIGLTASNERISFTSMVANTLVFENKGQLSLIVDDFRIKRVLNKPQLRLLLARSNKASSMNMYRFSVWMREDLWLTRYRRPIISMS